MASLTLEEIVKWALAIMVLVLGIYLTVLVFLPGASEQFWGKINNATGFFKVGKEKLDYEFEMPSYMVDNVETINETILALSKSEDKTKKDLKLEAFQGCELTVRQDYKVDLNLIVKNTGGQIEYYKTNIPYSPCIVDLEEGQDVFNYQDNKLDNIKIRFVERINFKEVLFPTVLVFKGHVNEEDEYKGYYKFPEESPPYTYKNALIKIGKDICFVGRRINIIKE